MTCNTCGRENPPHLTFCQECGQRLGPRVAPPTPPIGLGGDPTPPPPAAGDPNKLPPRVATSFGGVTAVSPSNAPNPHPATTTERRCPVCDTVNAAGLRYCTTCGSTLEA